MLLTEIRSTRLPVFASSKNASMIALSLRMELAYLFLLVPAICIPPYVILFIWHLFIQAIYLKNKYFLIHFEQAFNECPPLRMNFILLI